MSALAAEFGTSIVIAAFAVMLLAGFVKGAVGFALPMISISGIGTLMTAELAIAAIILPAIATNLAQSVRGGPALAWATLCKYWRLNLALLVLIGLFAQLVAILPAQMLFLILGAMVTLAGSVQLIGWRPHFAPEAAPRAEWITGGVASFFGGLAGVWGPPILLYLIARNTPKAEIVRTQGIAFLVGALVLVVAHQASGVLAGPALVFSATLVVPAMAGLYLGRIAQDRLDQERFRKLTLMVLVLAGLNLLRRGFFA